MRDGHSTGALPTAVLVLVAIAAVAAAGQGAAAGTAAMQHESPANLTINPVSDADHMPGQTNASYQIFATGEDALDQDIESLDYAVIRYEAGDVSSCTAFATAVFGVDRGNDDPGTKTDESLVNNQENSGHSKHEIYVNFYDEDDLGGSSTYLNRDDQIVAYDKDCYQNPDQAGWYQFTGKINGTAEDGSDVSIKVDSHYFYICDCESREQAVEKLGAPPSGTGGSGGTDGSSGTTPTATATPESTATATAAGSTGGSTPERTATTTATATETATATATATPESTATATAAATAESTATADGGGAERTPTATATARASGAAAADGSADRRGAAANAGGGPTPTYGDGAGFGVGATLAGLFGAALLALRRRR